MKKPLLNSGLKAYSALAGSFLAAGNVAEASVVYKNIDPDVTKTQTTIGSTTYDIDMNNDGTVDFKLATFKVSITTPTQAAATGVGIYPQNTNQVAVDADKYAMALAAGANINNTLSFYDGDVTHKVGMAVKGTYAGTGYTYANFANTTNKFVGVQFTVGANTFFGWIRVDVGNYNTFTVKDFAFENTPNTAILAGQGIPAGVQSSYLNNITTIKNIDNVVKIEFEKVLEGNVEIMNVSGAILNSATFNGTSSEMNLQTYPAGIYNVIITTKEGVLVKKIFAH